MAEEDDKRKQAEQAYLGKIEAIVRNVVTPEFDSVREAINKNTTRLNIIDGRLDRIDGGLDRIIKHFGI